MLINQDDAIFLIIDIQEKLLNAVFNKEILEKKSKIMYEAASKLGLPIFVTEQYPQGLGNTVLDLKDTDNVYIKTTFDALADENLLTALKNTGKKQIIVSGIETHICVHQTVYSLIKNGFDVTVLIDVCGSRTEFEYNSGLSCMANNGAKLKTTEMVLFELLKTAKHPEFKAIQALIK